MSFILDALKKSESERRRQDTPGIANIPEAGRRNSGKRWIWLIAGLLAINLVVLAGLMLRPGGAPQSAAIESVAGDEPATASFSDLVIEVKRSRPEPAAMPPETSAPASIVESTLPRVTDDPPQSVSDGLATFNELRARGMLQLPDMHLDIHVYSGQPTDRFVFVNMSKYKEKDTLAEGPVVREITPDGMVLEYRGTAFLLPRE